LDQAIAEGRLSGQYYAGVWSDVGTPERLAALNG
jgi:MurNAc alpha-1-phosphate uridylyltransferase